MIIQVKKNKGIKFTPETLKEEIFLHSVVDIISKGNLEDLEEVVHKVMTKQYGIKN